MPLCLRARGHWYEAPFRRDDRSRRRGSIGGQWGRQAHESRAAVSQSSLHHSGILVQSSQSSKVPKGINILLGPPPSREPEDCFSHRVLRHITVVLCEPFQLANWVGQMDVDTEEVATPLLLLQLLLLLLLLLLLVSNPTILTDRAFSTSRSLRLRLDIGNSTGRNTRGEAKRTQSPTRIKPVCVCVRVCVCAPVASGNCGRDTREAFEAMGSTAGALTLICRGRARSVHRSITVRRMSVGGAGALPPQRLLVERD